MKFHLRIGDRIIRKIADILEKDAMADDIFEEYQLRQHSTGSFYSDIWYGLQIVRVIVSLNLYSLFWRFTMFKNYLLMAWRNISKQKAYSFINIIGLAVGLSVFLLIGLYVQNELTYDKYHENSDNIYRVVREERTCTPSALGPALMQEIPEVVTAARLIRSRNALISYGQRHFLEEDFYWAENQIFNIFSIPFIAGGAETALKDQSSILLSESVAKKYFGDDDPVGKVLLVSEQTEFTVAGVFRDMPANSHFVMDVIVPYMTYFELTGNNPEGWRSNFSYTYFLMQEDADPVDVQEKIHTLVERPLYIRFGFEEPFPKMYSIQPITDIHLHSHRMQEINVNSDIKYVMLFSAIAVLILIIACINYMNLATARSIQRGKEVGIRKVSGAQRGQLIFQFLSESTTVTVLALCISIIITLLVLPGFNNLIERQLTLNPIDNPLILLGLIIAVCFVGLFAGSYPALVISRFKPITVLCGSFVKSSKGTALRNILVLVQFSIAIVLIVSTIVVRMQLRYMKITDVGYSREQIINLPIRDRSIRGNIETIKTELMHNVNIHNVCTSANLPNNIDTFTSRDWTGRNPQPPVTIYYNTTGPNYADLFDMEIVQGRNFSEDFPSDLNGAILVNETAVRIAEWESPIGKEMTHWTGATGRIVGVLKDFHLHSLHSPIEPLYIFMDASTISNISIKISTSDIPSTISYIKDVMNRFSPSYPFEYSFFDEIFNDAYQTEQRMATVFGSFSIIAIIIAFMGLIGLATFVTAQRTKELGVRKILGASVMNIIFLLSGTFLRWVVLANIIAWPVAYLLMRSWLENFAYHITLSPWIFMISGLSVFLVAIIVIGYQSIKSALINPARALKYE